MNFDEANDIAHCVMNAVAPVCNRIEIAGSIRRRKDIVKDIELVAQIQSYDSLFEALQTQGMFIKPGTSEIIAWPPKHGNKYVRMMLPQNIKLDFFIATPHNWGPLFMMRTGSAAGPHGNPFDGFVPAMFSAWKKVSGGGYMSGCMPTLPDGTSLVVPEEADFFELCNVSWIEPQDRISAQVVKKAIKK